MYTQCASGLVTNTADHVNFDDYLRENGKKLSPGDELKTPPQKKRSFEKLPSASESSKAAPYQKPESFKAAAEGLTMFKSIGNKLCIHPVSPTALQRLAAAMPGIDPSRQGQKNDLIRAGGHVKHGRKSKSIQNNGALIAKYGKEFSKVRKRFKGRKGTLGSKAKGKCECKEKAVKVDADAADTVDKSKERIVTSLRNTGCRLPAEFSMPTMFGCTKCRYAHIGCKQCRDKKGYTLEFRVYDGVKEAEMLWRKLEGP